MKPQTFIARLVEKEVFNPKFTKYIFEIEKPHNMKFQAGQFVSVKVADDGTRRSYSICSDASIDHSFELVIDYAPNGKGVNFFKQLQIGEDVEVMGPLGHFTITSDDLHSSRVKEFALVATGSGIAPFRSIILDLLHNKQEQRPITLYWGLRYTQDLFWENEFQDLVESYPNFRFHPTLSKAVPEWSLCKGRVTDCLSIHQLTENTSYYLCGGTKMIEDVVNVLKSRGVAETDLHYEKFF